MNTIYDDFDQFDDAFDSWFNSEQTQLKFHCGQYSESQIALASAYWARNYILTLLKETDEACH